MGVLLYIGIFLSSSFLMFWLGSRLVNTLLQVARYLHWREFIVAFFIMAMASSLPNLFVDANAALRKMPELSFGDIVGGNVVDLTIVVALATFIGKGSIKAESRMVQGSTIFTVFTAVLPLLLIADGNLSRIDGLILIAAFVLYVVWLFSEEERFRKVYDGVTEQGITGLWGFFKNLAKIFIFIALLLFASDGIVRSAQVFAGSLGTSLAKVGILIVGLGNCVPETYFSLVSSRKNQNWMILGDLMGSVIVCATLVLGIVAIIAPIHIADFSPFAIARLFTIIAALFFLFVIRTGQKVTKGEGMLLLGLYIAFLMTEIFFG